MERTKLIVAIVHQERVDSLTTALSAAKMRLTTISTTGGFLKQGNATVLIGIEEERLEDALAIIKENCQKHKEWITAPALFEVDRSVQQPEPVEIEIGGAVVFVLDVDSMWRF